MIRKEIRGLVWAFFLISLGGLLLHLRIHRPAEKSVEPDSLPFRPGGHFRVAIPVQPSRETVAYAYLVTWAAVCAGTVGMSYLSVTA